MFKLWKLKIKLEENLRFAVMFFVTVIFSKLKSISKIIFVNFKNSYILTSYLLILILFLLIYHILCYFGEILF